MADPCPSKLDRVCHEIFASTLRANNSSPRDEVPNSRRLLYADKVAALANKLSDPKTLKLNLLKAPKLRKLAEVEKDFLKAAIPVLTCSARPYNTPYVMERGVVILNRWAGITSSTNSLGEDDVVTELLITPQAFKNTLLKLLNGNSDDQRVVNMRNQISGAPWSTSIDGHTENAVDDDAECTFHPRLNAYPRYLKNAPKPRYPKNTVARKLKDVLETPQQRNVYEEEEDVEYASEAYGMTDYGSPFNNYCPLTTPLRGYKEHVDHSPYGRVAPHSVDDILKEVGGIEERVPSYHKEIDTGLRFITPHKNHLYSEVGSLPQQNHKISSDQHPKYGVEPCSRKYFGSMKECDYILPQHGMLAPVFTHSRKPKTFTNEVYQAKVQNAHNGSKNALDILEAQLAQPIVNIMKLRC